MTSYNAVRISYVGMLKQCMVNLCRISSTENVRNRKMFGIVCRLCKFSEEVNMILLNVRGYSSRSSGCNVVLCMDNLCRRLYGN